MSRKEKEYNYIYKTTCKVTERYYIGMHSTSNLDDGYLGSGKRLWYSLNRYGKENHNKEILEYLPDRSSLKKREKEIVTSDLIKNNLCMNLKEGGDGGFISLEACTKGGLMAGKIQKEKIESNPEYREILKEQWVKKVKLAHETGKIKYNGMLGKKMTESAKRMMGDKNKIKQKGESNSQHGTCWITKDGENKKIKKDELPDWNKEGWINGRDRSKEIWKRL